MSFNRNAPRENEYTVFASPVSHNPHREGVVPAPVWTVFSAFPARLLQLQRIHRSFLRDKEILPFTKANHTLCLPEEIMGRCLEVVPDRQ